MYPTADPERALPPLYARWLEGLIPQPLPAEPQATCQACAMLAEHDPPITAQEGRFNPQTKCCTHLPALPNFTIGLILNDPDPGLAHGRESLRQRLARGLAVTPLGLSRPQDAPLDAMVDVGSFGQEAALRCPHYTDGFCGIWKYRNAICATWFCKHAQGVAGLRFWHQVQAYLWRIERHLSLWCLHQLGIAPDVIEALGYLEQQPVAQGDHTLRMVPLNRHTQPSFYAQLWGQWQGREDEFYGRCAELVLPLRYADVRRIAGVELVLRGSQLKSAHQRLQQGALPARLRRTPHEVFSAPVPNAPGLRRVWTYSPFSPLDVPEAVLGVLHHFDGRPTQQVVQGIATREGVVLDAPLLQRLVAWGLLEGVA